MASNETLDFIFERWSLDRNKKYIRMQGFSREGTLARLFRRLNFKLGCEVGVERARFSKILCQANPTLKLYGVDPWLFFEDYRNHVNQERLDEFFRETRERMKPFNFQIIRDSSVNAARRFDDQILDFVYIDAMHDYKSVKEDIAAWHPKVKKGGIVSGHDYVDGRDNDRPDKPDYGVKKAVNQWVEEKHIKHLFILEKDHVPSWFYVK